MMKSTHSFVALAITVPLIIDNPTSFIGVIGAIAPDWDYYLGIKHRTTTHSISALILTTLSIYWFDSKIALVWFISYLSHLILDSLTVTGVPFLYPLVKKRYSLGNLKTRSGEDLFIQLLAIAYICFNFLE